MARSLTVPCTASEPMSPPGKNSGFTTNESVVNARCDAAEFQNRLIVHAIQHGIRKQRQKDVAQQVRAQASAAAMAEHDFVARAIGGGADERGADRVRVSGMAFVLVPGGAGAFR